MSESTLSASERKILKKLLAKAGADDAPKKKVLTVAEKKERALKRVPADEVVAWKKEDKIFTHLWARCKNFASGDYFFFRSLSTRHTGHARAMSTNRETKSGKSQLDFLMEYNEAYKNTDETPRDTDA